MYRIYKILVSQSPLCLSTVQVCMRHLRVSVTRIATNDTSSPPDHHQKGSQQGSRPAQPTSWPLAETSAQSDQLVVKRDGCPNFSQNALWPSLMKV